MAPPEEKDRDYLRNWKIDIYKLSQGNGNISSGFWLGTNGTEKFKSAMMLERLFNLVTCATMIEDDQYAEGGSLWDMVEWFPEAIPAAKGRIINYQTEDPERSDEHFHKKTRIRSFQRDIANQTEDTILASQVTGNVKNRLQNLLIQ